MKLPDLISALERNEYDAVLRGTPYDPNEHDRLNSINGQAEANLQLARDAKANAATVTVLREAVRQLAKELQDTYNETLWNAYHSGHVRDGKWGHMFMSDGEWLARTLGFDQTEGYYFDAEVKKRVEAARHPLLALTAPLVNENNNEKQNG